MPNLARSSRGLSQERLEIEMSNAQKLRAGVREAADSLDQAEGRPDRAPAFTYVPPSHARALDPEATLVEGIRGAGKSFWWAQLAREDHREFIQAAFPEVRFDSKLKVARGFGTGLKTTEAPSAAPALSPAPP